MVVTAVKVVPKGLRPFGAGDSDYFLDLLPGTPDGRGLPEIIAYWKDRIEDAIPGKNFRVGIIFGPSGCGKSSLIRAGLLPNLADHVLTVDIEATADKTESLILEGLRERCSGAAGGGLVETISALSMGSGLPEGKSKVLIIIDQFEQWLHAHRSGDGRELVDSLKNCNGRRVQAIISVRADFYMASTRFMAELGVEMRQDSNWATMDLFGERHAKKVLKLFGQAYGALPTDDENMTDEQKDFLDQSVHELAREDGDGRIAPVRLSLFAQMLSEKEWTPLTLQSVGGAKGVGVRFLEETFDTDRGRIRYHIGQSDLEPCRLILKALLPDLGTGIKGGRKSELELLKSFGLEGAPDRFRRLIGMLDGDLRMITPTASEEVEGESATVLGEQIVRYYQLTHDYLVPSIREWLTRRQRETRRGRAELRLADRSAIWAAKPENRQLPSLWEWSNIRLLTRSKDWTEPQRRMMEKAARVHGLRGLGMAALVGTLIAGGSYVRNQFAESKRTTEARGLVTSVLKVKTDQVPGIVASMKDYRRWVDPALKEALRKAKKGSPEELHARLSLLPADAAQVEPLYDSMVEAEDPDVATVIGQALEPHRETLKSKLWAAVEQVGSGEKRILPAASALALYDPTNPRWADVSDKVARALVSVNSLLLRPWVEALRPVRGKLTVSLATIFREKSRSKSVHSVETDILTDYASEDPNLIADLLMDSDQKTYPAFFPIAQRQQEKTLPLFQAEIALKPTFSWNDPPLDPSWTTPDSTLTGKIESAQGMLTERFAFCQTMPLDEFLTTAEAIRPSGYRPIRFRPYAEGKNVRVAAVWVRDSRPWRLAHDQSTDEIRQTNERNRKEGFLPVDVAGYLAAGGDEGKPTSRFAALWAQRTGPDDDARMVLASSVAELTKVQEQLKDAGLVPLTLHAWRQADDKLSYSGIWHKTATGTSDTGSFQSGLSEADLPGVVAQQAGSLIDLDLAAAPPPPSTKERASSALQAAEAALKAKPDDLNARFVRAYAHFQLGENQKAIDDLNA